MKKFLVLALCLGCFPLRAQIAVEVKVDQQQFLPGEAIPVSVRVINRSGQTIRMGDAPDWLTFSIQSKSGFIVSKNGEAPVTGGFDLESSKVGVKRVDLAPYFNLTKPGPYQITATVRVKNWDTDFSNSPRDFDLIEGTRLWEQTFGVPSTNSAAEPEMRKFILQQANYLKKITLYIRLADGTETHVIRLFPVGPLLSFSRPEPQVDAQSNLHLLYQGGPHSFSYTIYDPNAELIFRKTYGYGNVRPKLSRDANGRVFVMGGVPVPSVDDFPATVSTNVPVLLTP